MAEAKDMKHNLLQGIGEMRDYELFAIFRKRLKLSQFDVYALTTVHPQHLSEFENGKRILPKETLEKLVALVNTPEDILQQRIAYLRQTTPLGNEAFLG